MKWSESEEKNFELNLTNIYHKIKTQIKNELKILL